jgi:hypothetical protein
LRADATLGLFRASGTVNHAHKKPRKLRAAELKRDFDRIFTAQVTKQVLDQDPADLFENAQGVMLGDGAVWAAGVCENRRGQKPSLLILVVNLQAK